MTVCQVQQRKKRLRSIYEQNVNAAGKYISLTEESWICNGLSTLTKSGWKMLTLLSNLSTNKIGLRTRWQSYLQGDVVQYTQWVQHRWCTLLCSFLLLSKVSVFFHTTCLHFCIQKEKVLQNEDQDYECTLLQCSTGDAVAAVVDIFDSNQQSVLQVCVL